MKRQRTASRGLLASARKTLYRQRWLVAAAAAFLLVGYLLHETQENSPFGPLIDAVADDAAFLSEALDAAKVDQKEENLAHFSRGMIQIGSTLEKVVGVAARNKAEPAVIMEPYINRAVAIYRSAVDFALQMLDPLLKREEQKQRENQPMWGVKGAVSYATTVVLPEYYFAIDDTTSHSATLVRGMQLLLQISNTLPIAETPSPPTNTTPKTLVDCRRHGTDLEWLQFCVSSFKNRTTLAIRRAAVLEELIALHPEYAPLRLHYAAAIALDRDVIQAHTVVTFITGEMEKSSKRAYPDPLHAAMLRLLKAFVLPFDSSPTPPSPSDLDSAAREALKGVDEIGNCSNLIRPFGAESNSSWNRRFRGVERPDVMDKWQAKELLKAMRMLKQRLQAGSEGSDILPAGFAECS
ncbi:hypothetical protein DPX39_110082800 [Trypanosoma brucei equiperdum]|uniref:Uncharacterized protein n=1 Tax=Trypanosoma brucei equiperdum TaxID=630700 RepID=A0A3L6KU74_9TRYP|nr:hypothetical protein DPX39_110082800 [Trypanosoma brucei equiperdum]